MGLSENQKLVAFSAAAFVLSGVIFFNIAWFTSTHNEGDAVTLTPQDQARLAKTCRVTRLASLLPTFGVSCSKTKGANLVSLIGTTQVVKH